MEPAQPIMTRIHGTLINDSEIFHNFNGVAIPTVRFFVNPLQSELNFPHFMNRADYINVIMHFGNVGITKEKIDNSEDVVCSGLCMQIQSDRLEDPNDFAFEMICERVHIKPSVKMGGA